MYLQYEHITSLFLFNICVTHNSTNKKNVKNILLFLSLVQILRVFLKLREKLIKINKIVFNDFKFKPKNNNLKSWII